MVKEILKFLKPMIASFTDPAHYATFCCAPFPFRYVFTLGGGAISWQSMKQSSIADSTMEAEYIVASEAAKEAVWLNNFLLDLGVVPSA